MQDLKQRYGHWALVTGGTSGIGAAFAETLAAQQINLVLVARGAAALEKQAAQWRERFGIEVRTVVADLSEAQALPRVLAAVEDLPIGILIPCAAMETQGRLVDADAQRERAMVQLNAIVPMELARVLGAGMVARGRGAILFVSSLSGWMPQPWMAGYGASKAYVAALAAGMHFELKGSGVDVSVLSPGPTDTPMAAATGIDFKSMGMSVMAPQLVAQAGLSALGQRLDAVPGAKNRVMVWMMARLLSRASAGAMLHKMMRKAMGR